MNYRQVVNAGVSLSAMCNAGVANALSSEGEDAAVKKIMDPDVVTARRTDESIQTIPVAVTAVSGAALRDKTIQNVNDLQQLTLNLTFQVTGSSLEQALGFNNKITGNPIRYSDSQTLWCHVRAWLRGQVMRQSLYSEQTGCFY